MLKDREAILSVENLKAMKLQVGDTFNLHYDVAQMNKLFQSMSGGGSFELLTLLQSDLEDKTVRDNLSIELERIFVNQFDVKIDQDGIMQVDMTGYLRDVA